MFAGLKVVGVDFPSHRALPNSSEISFFEENSISSFENAVMTAAKKKNMDKLDIKEFSLDVEDFPLRARRALIVLSVFFLSHQLPTSTEYINNIITLLTRTND